jgi:hypothetical protein
MWVLPVIRAVGVGVAIFAKRRPGITLIVVAYCALLAWLSTERFTETPQHAQARVAAAEQAAMAREAASAASQEINRRLCKLKAICEHYGRSRQQCAIAANFQNCLRVKLNDEDYERVDSCRSDGHIDPPSAEPSAFSCFFSGSP